MFESDPKLVELDAYKSRFDDIIFNCYMYSDNPHDQAYDEICQMYRSLNENERELIRAIVAQGMTSLALQVDFIKQRFPDLGMD